MSCTRENEKSSERNPAMPILRVTLDYRITLLQRISNCNTRKGAWRQYGKLIKKYFYLCHPTFCSLIHNLEVNV